MNVRHCVDPHQGAVKYPDLHKGYLCSDRFKVIGTVLPVYAINPGPIQMRGGMRSSDFAGCVCM